MDTLNFGGDINSGDLFFVVRFSSLGGSKYYTVGIYTGTTSRVLCVLILESPQSVGLYCMCNYCV